MWYKVVRSGTGSVRSWETGAENEEPVEDRPKSTTNNPNRPAMTDVCSVLASLVRVVAAPRRSLPVRGAGLRRGLNHVSRQSSNPGRRKRTAQGPGRVQAGDRREVRSAILHHKFGWQGCSSVSLRGVGADRAEAGRALQFQPYEEKVSRSDELLRAAGRDGRTGQAIAAAVAARDRSDQGGGSGSGEFDVSRGQEPGAVQERDRGRQVHARRGEDARRTGHLVGEGSTDTPQGVGHGGGRAIHVPVLLKEAIDFLAVRRGGA